MTKDELRSLVVPAPARMVTWTDRIGRTFKAPERL